MKISQADNFDKLTQALSKMEMKVGITGRKAVSSEEAVTMNKIVKQLLIASNNESKSHTFDKAKFNAIVGRIKQLHDQGEVALEKASFFKQAATKIARLKNHFSKATRELNALKNEIASGESVKLNNLRDKLDKVADHFIEEDVDITEMTHKTIREEDVDITDMTHKTIREEDDSQSPTSKTTKTSDSPAAGPPKGPVIGKTSIIGLSRITHPQSKEPADRSPQVRGLEKEINHLEMQIEFAGPAEKKLLERKLKDKKIDLANMKATGQTDQKATTITKKTKPKNPGPQSKPKPQPSLLPTEGPIIVETTGIDFSNPKAPFTYKEIPISRRKARAARTQKKDPRIEVLSRLVLPLMLKFNEVGNGKKAIIDDQYQKNEILADRVLKSEVDPKLGPSEADLGPSEADIVQQKRFTRTASASYVNFSNITKALVKLRHDPLNVDAQELKNEIAQLRENLAENAKYDHDLVKVYGIKKPQEVLAEFMPLIDELERDFLV